MNEVRVANENSFHALIWSWLALLLLVGCRDQGGGAIESAVPGSIPNSYISPQTETLRHQPAPSDTDPSYLPFVTTPQADSAYIVEIHNGEQVIGRVDFPFHYHVNPGDYLSIDLRGNQWREPRLGLRILQLQGEKEISFDPDDFTLTAEGSRLEPQVTPIDEAELKFEWYWHVPPETRRLRLDMKPQLKFAFKIAEEPLKWGHQAEKINIRANPFLDPNPSPELEGKDFLIDYYFRGAYRYTYFRPDFSRCTRPDDFMVLHLRPGAMAHPTARLLIRDFNHPLKTKLRENDWRMNTENGMMVASLLGEWTIEGNSRPGVTWVVPAETYTVILEQYIPVRFTLRVSDGPQSEQLRLATDSEPCFP